MGKRSDEPLECASPPCYAYEINPEHNGMTNQQHSISALQELLEGERAGARISKETLEVISSSEPPDKFTRPVCSSEMTKFGIAACSLAKLRDWVEAQAKIPVISIRSVCHQRP
ncbi:MAG: hypothetical protein ACI8Z1_001784 [Candidatus Azotimanducaceae bacterium]|jgi:hypothetical protein